MILLGIIVGLLMVLIIKKLKMNKILNITFMLSISFGMIVLENVLSTYFMISSLLAIIIMVLVVKIFEKDKAQEMEKSYNSLWIGFEILLFSLVGIATDVNYAFSNEGGIIIGLIIIALIFRSLGVLACLLLTEFTNKKVIHDHFIRA